MFESTRNSLSGLVLAAASFSALTGCVCPPADVGVKQASAPAPQNFIGQVAGNRFHLLESGDRRFIVVDGPDSVAVQEIKTSLPSSELKFSAQELATVGGNRVFALKIGDTSWAFADGPDSVALTPIDKEASPPSVKR